MEMITLANKKQVEVNLNGTEVLFELGARNIDHLQKVYKKPLAEVLAKMQSGDLTSILNLIYSTAIDKKTNKILGEKFFKLYDEFSILNYLMPVMEQLATTELPEAKDDTEKK